MINTGCLTHGSLVRIPFITLSNKIQDLFLGEESWFSVIKSKRGLSKLLKEGKRAEFDRLIIELFWLFYQNKCNELIIALHNIKNKFFYKLLLSFLRKNEIILN